MKTYLFNLNRKFYFFYYLSSVILCLRINGELYLCDLEAIVHNIKWTKHKADANIRKIALIV